MNNTNNGTNGKYTVAELTSNSTESPYPNVEWNSPPGGAINMSTYPPTGANYQNHFIGVQSVVVDPAGMSIRVNPIAYQVLDSHPS